MAEQYQYTFDLDNDFDQLFKDIELELVLRDSDDAAIHACAAKSPTTHDVLKVAAEEGSKGATKSGVGLCHKHNLITKHIQHHPS